jgi:soluble lytic murein transglycosylase-like protein
LYKLNAMKGTERRAIGRLRLHRASGLAVMAFVCFPLACVTGDADRNLYLREVLQKRAKHQPDSVREEILRGLVRAEVRTGIDVFLLLAVIEEESHFRPRVKSHRGALGLMQVRPSTGRDICRRHGIPWDGEATLFEPSINIRIGATYLLELEERFGSWDLALTAYNEGPTRARRAAMRGRKPSSRYASRVLRRTESLRGAAPDAGT